MDQCVGGFMAFLSWLLMMPPMPQAGRKRTMRMPSVLEQSPLRWAARWRSLSPARLQMSRPSRCSGVTTTCTASGDASCAIVMLLPSDKPSWPSSLRASTAGIVKAEATVTMSRRNSSAKVEAGKTLGWASPKCWMQALSLRMPQSVLQAKVQRRFCRGTGRLGRKAEWSVRLLTEQVDRQTKYIHLNLQEVKNSSGVVHSLRRPLLTPSPTVCLPLAYSMTERSRMALVGDTANPVTIPAATSRTHSWLEPQALIVSVVKTKNYLINSPKIYRFKQQYPHFPKITAQPPQTAHHSPAASNNPVFLLPFLVLVHPILLISGHTQTLSIFQQNYEGPSTNQHPKNDRRECCCWEDCWDGGRLSQKSDYNRIGMNQRHYSPDQLGLQQRASALKKSKRLREGGSTSKLLESGSRYCQEEVTIGDYAYRPSQEIGAGYSSRVYRAYGKGGQEFAMKVIEMKRFSASGLEMLEKEIEILRKLSHPNVVKLHHVHRTQTHTYLVTELCKHGDLQAYISRKGRLTEEAAAAVMIDVVEGVKYLMRMGVIHRDLKPANILRGDKIWKIADFGFSILSFEEVRTKQNVGTPLYMPIESLLKNLYSPESDIFAVGVIYYELMIGVTPWECRTEKELIKKLATLPFLIPHKYPLSSHIRYLLQKMCSVDLAARMKKEEFAELNLKNFVSLNNFNDPLLSSKDLTASNTKSEAKKTASPANKKSKVRPSSKDKLIKSKVDSEYKTGRKKSCAKVEPRRKSTEKEATPLKIFKPSNEGSSVKSKTSLTLSILPSEGSNVDRLELINERILGQQLDQCRFMYYLIKNNYHLPLPDEAVKRITLIVFKHLTKLIKQLNDTKLNYFKLNNWDSYKQLPKFKAFLATAQDYSEKYEKEYLRFLKDSDIAVIKDVNQKFSELAAPDPFTLSFYRKLQGLVGSALKEGAAAISTQDELTPKAKERAMALKTLLRYHRWLDENVKNFEKYAGLLSSEVVIVKSYCNQEVSRQQVGELCSAVRQI